MYNAYYLRISFHPVATLFQLFVCMVAPGSNLLTPKRYLEQLFEPPRYDSRACGCCSPFVCQIPSRQEALGMGDTEFRESVSDKDVRTILARFLDWLEGHDLAHFFVHDVDYDEYPEYRQVYHYRACPFSL